MLVAINSTSSMFSNFWSDRSTTVVWEDDTKQNKILLLSNSSIDSDRYRNWKRNRPPDLVRVDAIATHFTLNDVRMVPGVVYVWQPLDDSCAFVYDGIHRLLAAIRTDPREDHQQGTRDHRRFCSAQPKHLRSVGVHGGKRKRSQTTCLRRGC